MVLNFIRDALETALDSSNRRVPARDREEPPEESVASASESVPRRTELQLAEQRRNLDERERKERETKEEFNEFLVRLEVQEQQRRLEELLLNIADVKLAAGQVLGRAIETKLATGEALGAAKRNAILLDDGRRVYFTRDKTGLYSEDIRAITDPALIAQVRERQRHTNTTFEEFSETLRRDEDAVRNIERLESTITRLDEIETRLHSGSLTAEEIERARKETEDIINDLSPDCRAEYDRMQAARHPGQEPAYRAVDPSFSADSPVRAEAVRSQQALEGNETHADVALRSPAYRPAPGL